MSMVLLQCVCVHALGMEVLQCAEVESVLERITNLVGYN